MKNSLLCILTFIEDLRDEQPGQGQSIELASFAFFDIETTGLRPDRGARITEIAILKRSGDRYIWHRDECSNRDKAITAALKKVVRQLQTGVVVGHNVRFDLRFVAYEAERLGLKGLNIQFIDTLGLAQKMNLPVTNYRLATLLHHFEITVHGELHTAYVDAQCTRALFWKLVEQGQYETLKDAGVQQLCWTSF